VALRCYEATALRGYVVKETAKRFISRRSRLSRVAPYEKIHAWQAAHRLALETYRLTESWPRNERFELTAQVRRAALSIPANIAEGAGRWGPREFRRYLNIALGSLLELSYYLLFARDRGLLNPTDWSEIEDLRNRTGQLTWRLLQAVARRAEKGPSRSP
jgi:four helix bundle protein